MHTARVNAASQGTVHTHDASRTSARDPHILVQDVCVVYLRCDTAAATRLCGGGAKFVLLYPRRNERASVCVWCFRRRSKYVLRACTSIAVMWCYLCSILYFFGQRSGNEKFKRRLARATDRRAMKRWYREIRARMYNFTVYIEIELELHKTHEHRHTHTRLRGKRATARAQLYVGFL